MLVIKFFISKHANIALNYNILIGQKVYARMVFNKICKSMQYYQYYSYGHIIVQYTNKEVYEHYLDEHNSKNNLKNLLSHVYYTKKKNHKALEKIYFLKKQEIDQIVQALLFITYCYFAKTVIIYIFNIILDKNVFYKANISIMLFLLE